MAHIFSQYEQVDVKDFSIRALWRHSAAVALYARDIAACEKYDDDTSDACFVSGLLHDIGKLVLAVNLPAEYEAVMHKVHTEKCCLVDTEKEMLGASHAEVGAYLFGLWGFSDAVVEACAYHHFPSDCLSCDVELLTCVHVANMFDHDAQHINLGEKLDIGYLKNQGKEAKLSEWKQVAGLEV
jgi:HD-like signal output (HDOD) protein